MCLNDLVEVERFADLDAQCATRNLLDQNYQLVSGFPSEGRNFFVNLRIRS